MSAYKTYEFILEYPKILDVEGLGGPDRGDAKSKQSWLRALAKNPVFKVNAYFKTEEDVQDLIQDENFQNEVLNPKTGETTTRIKDGNEEYGCGKYLQLTRKSEDVREFIDSKTGEPKEVDYGGAPTVVIKVDGSFVPFDPEEFGLISNGSEAKIRFHTKYLRIEKVGITNLVEWVEGGEEVDQDGF